MNYNERENLKAKIIEDLRLLASKVSYGSASEILENISYMLTNTHLGYDD